MACSICDRAGHDEELHGEEGEEILRLREQNEALRDALDEIAKNAENLTKGGLPHFSRKEFADTVAFRARHALKRATELPSDTQVKP